MLIMCISFSPTSKIVGKPVVAKAIYAIKTMKTKTKRLKDYALQKTQSMYNSGL